MNSRRPLVSPWVLQALTAWDDRRRISRSRARQAAWDRDHPAKLAQYRAQEALDFPGEELFG